MHNGNADAAEATVDLNGVPRTPPSGAALATVSLFNRDPNRRAADPTGLLTRLYQATLLPNNFRTGDRLNTAGYTWQRRSTDDFDVSNGKVDHIFGTSLRASYTYNAEQEAEYNTRYEQTFPDSPGGTLTNFGRITRTSDGQSHSGGEYPGKLLTRR